jgi:intracellular sulfur oxidation DsrE/DsrF family protein
MNVIVHIDESEKWQTVLSNLKHLVEWYEDNEIVGTIELLVNGGAEQAVKQSDLQLNTLISSSVVISVCKNSLDQRHISSTELQDNIVIVPSGVVELAIKQNEGYGYIKP